MTKQHQIHANKASTAMDILTIAERDLVEFLRQLEDALDQLTSDLGLGENAQWRQIQKSKGELLHRVIDLIVDFRQTRNAGDEVTISLPYDQASRASDVADGVFYMLNQASEVFRLLDNTISNGDVRGDDSGVAAVMGLASRALRSMADTEGEIMGDLGRAVQHGLSQHINANLHNANAKAA
jgi:hypothetical protein